MTDMLVKSEVLNGGAFIIQDSTPDSTFIPEQLNEEQLMIKTMVQDFIKNDIEPNRVALEKQKEGLAVSLLEKWATSVCSAHTCQSNTAARQWIPTRTP